MKIFYIVKNCTLHWWDSESERPIWVPNVGDWCRVWLGIIFVLCMLTSFVHSYLLLPLLVPPALENIFTFLFCLFPDQHPVEFQCRWGLPLSRGDPGWAQLFPWRTATALWYSSTSSSFFWKLCVFSPKKIFLLFSLKKSNTEIFRACKIITLVLCVVLNGAFWANNTTYGPLCTFK